jgi:aspartate carbamoyltransferase regulatory subunit
MNVPKKEKPYSAMLLIKSSRNKGKDFIKKNQQLIRNREVDALVEMSRQVIMDKYVDLEN